jgi:hypothetical protein
MIEGDISIVLAMAGSTRAHSFCMVISIWAAARLLAAIGHDDKRLASASTSGSASFSGLH